MIRVEMRLCWGALGSLSGSEVKVHVIKFQGIGGQVCKGLGHV